MVHADEERSRLLAPLACDERVAHRHAGAKHLKRSLGQVGDEVYQRLSVPIHGRAAALQLWQGAWIVQGQHRLQQTPARLHKARAQGFVAARHRAEGALEQIEVWIHYAVKAGSGSHCEALSADGKQHPLNRFLTRVHLYSCKSACDMHALQGRDM